MLKNIFLLKIFLSSQNKYEKMFFYKQPTELTLYSHGLYQRIIPGSFSLMVILKLNLVVAEFEGRGGAGGINKNTIESQTFSSGQQVMSASSGCGVCWC